MQRNLVRFLLFSRGGSGYIYLRTWNCLDSSSSNGESISIRWLRVTSSIRKIRAFSSLPLFASDNCYRNSNYCFLRSSSQGTICRELINGQGMGRCKMHIPGYWIPFNGYISKLLRVNFFSRMFRKVVTIFSLERLDTSWDKNQSKLKCRITEILEI